MWRMLPLIYSPGMSLLPVGFRLVLLHGNLRGLEDPGKGVLVSIKRELTEQSQQTPADNPFGDGCEAFCRRGHNHHSILVLAVGARLF
jgi:hypothetical protein